MRTVLHRSIVALTFLVIAAVPRHALAQWSIVASTSNQNFRAVDFYDSQFGIAVGRGSIYKTEDGGLTWTVSDTTNFRSVLFTGIDIDSTSVGLVAIATGQNLTIVRSADRGVTWKLVNSGLSGASVTLHGACYTGNGRFTAFGDGGSLLSSMDTGLSWQTRYIFPSADMTASTCLPSGRIWVGGFAPNGAGCCNVMLRSDDLGESWTKTFETTNNSLGRFDEIRFVSDTTGFAVSTARFFTTNSRLWKTIDGGDTWESMGSFEEIDGMDFNDDSVGAMVGFEGLILWTEDGGETWVEHPSPAPFYLYDVILLDSQTAVAVGELNIIRNETGASVAVEEGDLPRQSVRHSAYPNPASHMVTISFDADSPEPARLIVTDLLGRKVSVFQTRLASGHGQSINLSLASLPGGMYFYSIAAGRQSASGSFLVTK